MVSKVLVYLMFTVKNIFIPTSYFRLKGKYFHSILHVAYVPISSNKSKMIELHNAHTNSLKSLLVQWFYLKVWRKEMKKKKENVKKKLKIKIQNENEKNKRSKITVTILRLAPPATEVTNLSGQTKYSTKFPFDVKVFYRTTEDEFYQNERHIQV